MAVNGSQVFLHYGFFIALLFVAGLYCIIVTRNLMRILIGIELLMKAATLLLVVAGYVTGRIALAQAVVITMVVIEVVIMAVTAGVILSIHRNNDSLDARRLNQLKG